MDNLTISELAGLAFRWHSHNSSYVTPGYYDTVVKDAAWLLTAPIYFFAMATGLAMVEAGSIRSKNKVNVMVKNIVDMCASGMCFWLFGYGLMFGRGEYTNGLFGAGDFFLNVKQEDPLAAPIFSFYMFELGFATSATSIMSGSCSERFRFKTYIMFSFCSMFLYGIGGGWVWGDHGFLRNIGVLDFAGAGPVHIIGGAAGFVCAWFIGPRLGRYDKTRKDKGIENPFTPADRKTMITGCFILWWGWVAFNAGSSCGVENGRWVLGARAGAATVLSSMASGTLTFFLSSWRHNGKADALECVSGVLSALVAINAGCYIFSMRNAVITGIVSALLCFYTAPIIDRWGVDDAVGSTALNYMNGAWGHFSVGLFADPITGPKGLFVGGEWFQLSVQTISVICLTLWAAIGGLIMIWLINKIAPVRLSAEDEITGCDYTEHYQRRKCGDECECYDGQPNISPLDQILSLSSRVVRRFSGGLSPAINRKQFRDFTRRFSLNVDSSYTKRF